MDLGLLAPKDVVDRRVVITEHSMRNRVFRVSVEREAGYFVKQPLQFTPNQVGTVWTEATWHWLVANDPAFAPARAFTPPYVCYDPGRHVLVLGLLPDARTLAVARSDAGHDDVAAATSLGAALRTLHVSITAAARTGTALNLFKRSTPWILTVHRPNVSRFVPATAADVEALSLIRRDPIVCRSFDEILAAWRPECLIHGDLKWSNCVVAGTDSERRRRMFLVDWEIASIGDARWDVASLIQAYALAAGAPSRSGLAGRLITAPVSALIASYGASAASTVETVRFAGARLLQSILEATHHARSVPAWCFEALTVARGMLREPAAIAQRWNIVGAP